MNHCQHSRCVLEILDLCGNDLIHIVQNDSVLYITSNFYPVFPHFFLCHNDVAAVTDVQFRLLPDGNKSGVIFTEEDRAAVAVVLIYPGFAAPERVFAESALFIVLDAIGYRYADIPVFQVLGVPRELGRIESPYLGDRYIRGLEEEQLLSLLVQDISSKASP